MRIRGYVTAIAIVLVTFLGVSAQSNTFTYQGKLTDGGAAANGTYLMQFSLWDSVTGGNQIGQIQDFGGGTLPAVQVNNGIFTVQLDFGSPTPPFDNTPRFDGSPRWIAIAVRKIGELTYTPLSPRQPITSSPYSIKSTNSGAADSLSGNCVLCVSDAHIAAVDGTKVTGVVNNAQNALNAVNVVGIVPVTNGGTGSSSKNFVDLSTDQAVAGNKTFSGSITVTGANGVFNGNGAGLTNLSGANISGGSITTSQLSGDAQPNSSSLKLLGSLRWDLLKGTQTFPAGGGTVGVIFDGANLWVANDLVGGGVTKLRASDGAILATIPLGVPVSSLAFDGSRIWCTFGGSSVITRLRASDGGVIDTVTVGSSLAAPIFDGANIWVANQINPGTINKVRASDGAVLGTFSTGGNAPQSPAFDGANVWIPNRLSNNVTKLRASDGACVGVCTFAVGTNPQAIAFDGTNIWVANQGSGTVTKLRGSDGGLLDTITVGSNPIWLTFDGSNIWVANLVGQNVSKIRVSDDVVVGTFDVAPGGSPERLAFDGTNIWVTTFSQGITRLPPTFP